MRLPAHLTSPEKVIKQNDTLDPLELMVGNSAKNDAQERREDV